MNGYKEAEYRSNAADIRARTCMENRDYKLAVIFPDNGEEYKQVQVGVELAVSEANVRLNARGSAGVTVMNANKTLQQKRVKTKYYSYNPDYNDIDVVVDLARGVSRDYSIGAALGFYTSAEAYQASLIFQESGLLYFSPFSTSSRITSHDWPLVIRTASNVDTIMSALLESLSQVFDLDHGTIRLAVLTGNSIYSEDAETAIHSHIAKKTRLYGLIRRTDKLITDDLLPGNTPLLEWLATNEDNQETLLDQFDISDKLFMIQKLAHYGFTRPGISIRDLDIDRLHEIGNQLFEDSLTVASTIDSMKVLNPDYKIVYTARYEQGQSDFSTQLRMLSKVDADIIVLLDYMNPTSMELLTELQEAGNMLPIIADDGFEYPGLLKDIYNENSGELYIISIYDDDKHGVLLNEKYNELCDYLPKRYQMDDFDASFQTFQAYKTASLLLQAMEESKSTDPATIASRIKNVNERGWRTLNGSWIHFDSQGDIIEPEFFLKRYEKGTFKRI